MRAPSILLSSSVPLTCLSLLCRFLVVLHGLTPVKNRYTQSNEIISGVKAMETPGTGLFRSSLASGASTGLDAKLQDQVSGPAMGTECACFCALVDMVLHMVLEKDCLMFGHGTQKQAM